MFFRSYKMVISGMLLFLLSGCTHYYVPVQYPIKPGMISEFSGRQAVTIVNAQTSTEPILIGSQGFHKWMGDLQQWTDTAAGLLKSELEKRGFKVTEDAPKELKLAINQVQLFWGFAAIRCVLTLKVETGDGYTREFEGNNPSPATLYRACDGAVTRAVAAMLNDDEILAYLEE